MPIEDVAQNPETPNVLLICCDQLRGDWLGCNGHPLVQTPNIDQLAHQGVNFTRAWSECPTCVPARRTIMTGMGPYGIHMNTNRGEQPFPEGPKLAEVMSSAGYQTHAVGKMHTYPMRNHMGFDDVLCAEDSRRDENGGPDDYHLFLARNGMAHRLHFNGVGGNEYGARLSAVPEEFTCNHWIADEACKFIQRRDPTRPFLLYASFEQPHPPFTPPFEFWELYRDIEFPDPVRGAWVDSKTPAVHRELQGRSNLMDWLDRRHIVQQNLCAYAAMITHIDAMVGVMIGQLNDYGLTKNTHIIFIADHGEALFDHEAVAKGTPFHGPANVPLIMAPSENWVRETARPDLLGGDGNTVPAGLRDVMPTVLDMCGIDVPANVEGVSLLPFAREDEPGFRKWTCCRYACNYGATDGRHTYMWFADESDVELLFDRDTDPRECTDLSENPDYTEVKREARAALIDWMTAGGDERIIDGEARAIPFNWVNEYTHTKSMFALRGRR